MIDEEGQLKICDFGVSRLLSKKKEKIVGQAGTPAYMAPEIIQHKEHNGFACDVWSLGVCLFAMICGAVPFWGKCVEDLNQAIIAAKPDFPDNLNLTLNKDLLSLLS